MLCWKEEKRCSFSLEEREKHTTEKGKLINVSSLLPSLPPSLPPSPLPSSLGAVPVCRRLIVRFIRRRRSGFAFPGRSERNVSPKRASKSFILPSLPPSLPPSFSSCPSCLARPSAPTSYFAHPSLPPSLPPSLISREDYRLFWPVKSEFVRLAARFGATIIPFSAVGAADSFNMLLDSKVREGGGGRGGRGERGGSNGVLDMGGGMEGERRSSRGKSFLSSRDNRITHPSPSSPPSLPPTLRTCFPSQARSASASSA